MEQEQNHKKNAAADSVRIQKSQQCAVKDVFVIERYSLKDVGKGNSEEQRRTEAANEQAGVPQGPPCRAVQFAAKFKGDGPDDQSEENQQEWCIEGAEHHGVGGGERFKGHASRG